MDDISLIHDLNQAPKPTPFAAIKSDPLCDDLSNANKKTAACTDKTQANNSKNDSSMQRRRYREKDTTLKVTSPREEEAKTRDRPNSVMNRNPSKPI